VIAETGRSDPSSYADELSFSTVALSGRFPVVATVTKTKTAKRRGRAAHLGPERRRPQVLDAALAITFDQGVSEVTIGAIAERLNVTRPVVYACFPDRVQIITALLERETAILRDALIESLHSARGDSPEAAFTAGYQTLLRVVESRPGSWRFVFFSTPDRAVANRFTRVRAQLSEATSSWLRPVFTEWWSMADAEAKLPVLVELLLSSSEAAVRSLLDTANTWTADELGELYGRMMCGAFSVA
jgi:AcrR family transcriptional regulator